MLVHALGLDVDERVGQDQTLDVDLLLRARGSNIVVQNRLRHEAQILAGKALPREHQFLLAALRMLNVKVS